MTVASGYSLAAARYMRAYTSADFSLFPSLWDAEQYGRIHVAQPIDCCYDNGMLMPLTGPHPSLPLAIGERIEVATSCQ